MRNLKFIIAALLFSVSMVVLTDKEASAAPTIEGTYDLKLKDLGVPEEVINNMSVSKKEHIVNSNPKEYLGGEKGILTTDSEPQKEGEFTTFGVIPQDEMEFRVDIFNNGYTSDGRDMYMVIVGYTWLQEPFWKLQDPFGVKWDESKFRYQDGSSYSKIDYCHGGDLQTCINWNTESSTIYPYSGDGGLGWNADLKGHATLSSANSGFGSLILETKDGVSLPSGGSSQVHAYYAHDIDSWGSIGLEFKGFSVSFSGSSSVDERALTKTFYY
ncbi:hypothetical protein ACFQWC_07055 [Rossellomorea sp. GCM10028870]|uniref:hypothetical protein n=1 Tax=Rossellomorea sp. GCM10028870 TaxID=3273426 RepID=UPI00361D9F86